MVQDSLCISIGLEDRGTSDRVRRRGGVEQERKRVEDRPCELKEVSGAPFRVLMSHGAILVAEEGGYRL